MRGGSGRAPFHCWDTLNRHWHSRTPPDIDEEGPDGGLRLKE